MNQQLVPSDKNLISARDAAVLSGYAKDYITRLCRTGKVVGELVGRTWFVEETSLRDFMLKTETERVERLNQLSQERRNQYQQQAVEAAPGESVQAFLRSANPLSPRETFVSDKSFSKKTVATKSTLNANKSLRLNTILNKPVEVGVFLPRSPYALIASLVLVVGVFSLATSSAAQKAIATTFVWGAEGLVRIVTMVVASEPQDENIFGFDKEIDILRRFEKEHSEHLKINKNKIIKEVQKVSGLKLCLRAKFPG